MGDGIGLEADRGSCGGAKASQRINTTVHMCWHRNTSISYSDQLRAFQVSKKESVFIDASKVIRGKWISIYFRINLVDFCYGNSRIVMVGKSFGSSLPIFACSFTNLIETIFHWLVCHCWDTRWPNHRRRMVSTKILFSSCNSEITFISSVLRATTRLDGKNNCEGNIN